MRLVGRDKRVLELGCATGYMSRALTNEFGCTVTGIEVNPEAAEAARGACERVIVGDLDAIDWAAALGAERFDVVVAADVLEHLRDPARILAAVRAHLAAAGYVVASIPNVAHAAVLAELLQGRFVYQPFGLLDDTHIRFFTRDSIYQCFEEAGFTITHLERLTLEPAQTEFRTTLSAFPIEVANWLASREESSTYQFILTAHPSASSSVSVDQAAWPRSTTGVAESTFRPVLEKLAAQPGGSAVEGMLWAHAARLAYLEDTRAHQAQVIVRLEEALARQESYSAAVQAESEARQRELCKAQPYVASLLAEIASLRQRDADDSTVHLRQALDASERRLLLERERLGDVLEAERNRLAREREETRRGLDEERTRLTRDLEEERRRAAGEQERQEEVIARLTTIVDTYERSRSWRMTAPLRAAARLFARSRRSP
jgi:2-polyprenyl-3-methyl-5-hydroxy-6-metoxy-1,4-benzoquinol methylase